MGYTIHPTAVVEKTAELGDGVEVGPFSVIGADVKIGANTKIGPHVVIEGHTTIGPDNKFFQFTSIGAAPQDLKYKGEPATLVIGAGNTFRENVTVHRGTATGTMTTIVGDQNLFMACCHVAHDCRVGNGNVFANSVALAGHVEVRNRAILGGLVGMHQFTRVGDLAMIGAGSMVGGDVPPFAMAQGDRCHIRGINIIGLKRAGMTHSDVSAIKQAYHYLFLAKGSMEERIKTLPAEIAGTAVVKQILDFISGSKRGFIVPRRGAVELDNSPEG